MDWVIERMSTFGGQEALIDSNKLYKYSDVIDNINSWKNRLEEYGIKSKEVVALYGNFCPEMLFAMFSLIINENIVAPVSTEKKDKLEVMLDAARVDKLLIFENDKVECIDRQNKESHELLEIIRREKDAGVIIFTSGSTGDGKCALNRFSSMTERLRGVTKRKALRTLIFLKMDHIGGINTIFSILLQGGTMILINDRSVQNVCSLIEKYKVELLPTTPSFINMMIISGALRDYDLSSLSFITYGTEPMPAITLKTISSELPGVKIKQTYGLTELGIFSTKSKDNSSTWMKLGGNKIEVEIRNNILFIRSPYAMLGYLNAPSPFDDEGWYNTGDEVEVDGDYIHILGRNEEIINVGGEKVFPAEIEGILSRIPNVSDVVVKGKSNPITGQIVTAVFQLKEAEDEKAFKKRVMEYCRNELEPYKIPRMIFISDSSFISTNLKKQRL